MVNPDPAANSNQHQFASVKEGMDVFDADDHRVGKVKGVYSGEHSLNPNPNSQANPISPVDAEAARDITAMQPQTGWMESGVRVAGAIEGELPEVVRNRLMQEGYLRVDRTGLFARDGFILPDQIRVVREGYLRLNIRAEEVITPD